MKVSGNVVNLLEGTIVPATVEIVEGRVAGVKTMNTSCSTWLLPGFIDAHVHVESSLVTPGAFARAAVVHGTVAALSDPHEIANVLGLEGVRFMIQNAKSVPFKFSFGASPCVPATPFETSGGTLDVHDMEELFQSGDAAYMSEMMNFPDVLAGAPQTMAKIALARRYNKPVDGHAPGLRGLDARRYAQAGISTDHECMDIEEAREKISYGMKILIREGSAARNFDVLAPLIGSRPDKVMFCSDDLRPGELMAGHINALVRRALARGYDLMSVLRCASLNPVRHYGLDVGLLQPGDPADFIEVDGFEHLNVLRVFINGHIVAEKGHSLIERVPVERVNRFSCLPKEASDFRVSLKPGRLKAIGVADGQLVTQMVFYEEPAVEGGQVVSAPQRDLLKITVVNRYQNEAPAMGFIKGFGLRAGALAASVAHDSHNIIAVGVDDRDICRAVNLVISHKGGMAVVAPGEGEEVLPLPVAGLMTDGDCGDAASGLARVEQLARDLGCTLKAPFMALSFMALLVIPKLKLSDKGLFDGEAFEFTGLFEGERLERTQE